MSDYKELVKALRHCGKDLMPGERCKDSCPYGDIALCLPKLKLDAADAIEDLQAQFPKRGEWINSKERMRPDMCSVCGCVYEADRFMDKLAWNYCPNCGADMRKMEVQE